MRARAVIEEKESSSKSQIVVTELPYQVNKAKLIVDMAELVKEGKLEGISALRDESDKDGMRVVIELKRDAIPRVVLKDFRRAPITFPPKDEQCAIVHILGTLDDKIELNRRMNATLEEMARTLFKSWFVDFDPVRAKAAGRNRVMVADKSAAAVAIG